MRAKNFGVFFGWYVVAGAFLTTFVGFGSAYTFGSFLNSWESEFGASRGSISSVFALASFLYFSLGLISGPLADRWGARPIVAFGATMVGLGMIVASFTHSLIGICISFGLGIGIGVGSSYVPAVGVVQRWFNRRRGLASGMAVSGIGVGTLVFPFAAAGLIEAAGWRQAALSIGIVVLIVGIPAALLLEDGPERRGLGADNEATTTLPTARSRPGMAMAQALRTRAFAGLYLSSLCCAFGLFVPFVHLVPYALARGVTAGSASLLLGVVGVGSTIGRFALGSLADLFETETFLALMLCGMAASFGIWAFGGSYWTLLVFAFVFGACYGGWGATLPTLVMGYFGGRNVSGIIGILYTSFAFGSLAGPPAAGYVYDATKSYQLPIISSAVLILISAVIAFVMLKSPARTSDTLSKA
jgi:MFS transporter, OFA family, oxalate/formate antiporter